MDILAKSCWKCQLCTLEIVAYKARRKLYSLPDRQVFSQNIFLWSPSFLQNSKKGLPFRSLFCILVVKISLRNHGRCPCFRSRHACRSISHFSHSFLVHAGKRAVPVHGAFFVSPAAAYKSAPCRARCAFSSILHLRAPVARRFFASPQLLPRTAVRRLRGITRFSQRRPPKK